MAPRSRRRAATALFATTVVIRVGAQLKRLTIHNGCASAPIWIAHMAGPIPGPDPQNVKIEPMAAYDFATPDGLSATRYWPKMLCDENGNGCALGGSGGPGEGCVAVTKDYSSCAPPIDTKFEATFGKVGFGCDPATGQMEGCDHVDMSLVDGWTLPFRLHVAGSCGDQMNPTIDCSQLDFGVCPAAENLVAAGFTADLQAKHPSTGEVVGCYSPCSRLIDGKWPDPAWVKRPPQDPAVAPYCCPTPPETPEACRAGPIKDTLFVQAVHSHCPGVYAYSYDDAMGLLRCRSDSHYELTFYCPSPMAHQRPVQSRSSPSRWTVVIALILVIGLGAVGAIYWRGLQAQQAQQAQYGLAGSSPDPYEMSQRPVMVSRPT